MKSTTEPSPTCQLWFSALKLNSDHHAGAWFSLRKHPHIAETFDDFLWSFSEMSKPIRLQPWVHHIVIGAVCLIGVGMPPAFGAEDPSLLSIWSDKKFGVKPAEIFRAIDENGDKKIDEVELRIHKLGLFAERDTDRDDVLSRNELPLIKDSVFAGIDANKDGKISGFEFDQANVGRFENMNRDKNGYITMEEFMNFIRSVRTK